jgi:hypothetical protein
MKCQLTAQGTQFLKPRCSVAHGSGDRCESDAVGDRDKEYDARI